MPNDGRDKLPTRRKWLAVVSVSVFRLAVLASLAVLSPSLINSFTIYNITFWAVSLFTVAFYLRCALPDPGFQYICPSTYLPAEKWPRAKLLGERLRKEVIRTRELRKNPHKYIEDSFDNDDEPSSNSSEDEAEEFSGYPAFSSEGEEESDLLSSIRTIDLGSYQDDSFGAVIAEPPKVRPSLLGRAQPVNEPQSSSIVVTALETSKKTTAARRQQQSKLMFPLMYMCRTLTKLRSCWIFGFIDCLQRMVIVTWRDLVPVRKKLSSTLASPQVSDLFQLGASGLFQDAERLAYCDRCNHWKLLRSKHCRDCGICVRTHDHHCPWLGSCVGETNRLHFFHFLFWQTVELTWVTFEILFVTIINDRDWLDEKKTPDISSLEMIFRIGLLVVAILLMCLGLMTLYLGCLHAFLLITNLTTNEMVTWSTTTYLKYRDRDRGSPFSESSATLNCEATVLPLLLIRRQGVQKILAKCRNKLKFPLLGSHGEILWRIRRNNSDNALGGGEDERVPCANGYCNAYALFLQF